MCTSQACCARAAGARWSPVSKRARNGGQPVERHGAPPAALEISEAGQLRG
eukprot:CAMPEP_0206009016 /NCGR_PEP_ID=MMETSP1464-20131121/8812_1 /ASSEMBLY_ACC=CAM_ASM_001124 /TAXON_ID=119497 /ORGANISM="Exanthemachrysis gayraliae, Strain RCC1523" /LENGTH=50 /DNA_ID=CAMNT_0053382589 /DNA_START=17 /DNA_END=165 /DNA_ORIENTATION=-